MKENQNAAYNKLNQLESIGNKLADFEEIPNSKNGEPFSILGKGNYGYVEKMKSKIDNKIYAIKKEVKGGITFDHKNFVRETEIMINLKHENIVKFYGFFEDIEKFEKYKQIDKNNKDETKDKPIYCLVLEYIPNGTLQEYYEKNKDKIDQNFIFKILKQSLCALSYLASKSVMHRDMMLDNILLDENYNIKISGFSLSVKIPKDDLNSECTFVGRADFVCPEILKSEKYGIRTDIFSLGLMMLLLMSKKTANDLITLSKNNNGTIIRTINKDELMNNNNYNIYLKKLVLRMINDNKNMRPFAANAFYELEIIEKLVKNPDDYMAKLYLENVNDS